MGHKYDMGWDSKPKLDEARVIAPETSKHRSRKDRKRWCRGKVGVEHVREHRYEKWALYHATRENKPPSCRWVECGKYVRVEGQRHRDWVGNGTFAWACRHEFVCKNCGKIFERVGRQCKEFSPHPNDYKLREKQPSWNDWLHGDE